MRWWGRGKLVPEIGKFEISGVKLQRNKSKGNDYWFDLSEAGFETKIEGSKNRCSIV